MSNGNLQQPVGGGWDIPAAALGKQVEEEEEVLSLDIGHEDTISRQAPNAVSPELEQTEEDFTTAAFPPEPVPNLSGRHRGASTLYFPASSHNRRTLAGMTDSCQ